MYRKITSFIEDYLKSTDGNISGGTVISNERRVYQDGKITYLPVYFVMFMGVESSPTDDIIF